MQRPNKANKRNIKNHQLNAIYEERINKRQDTNLVRHVDNNGFVYYKEMKQNDNTDVDKKE